MLKIGQVSEQLRKQGYVCIADDYEEKAVRLENVEDRVDVFIKRKGHKEIRSVISDDLVQEIIHELNNRELTREEYNDY